MLVLGRKVGETIHLFGHPDGPIVIKVDTSSRDRCRLAIAAPAAVKILRGEFVADNGVTDAHDDDDPPSYHRRT